MKIIRPMVLNNTNLTSSNVVETDYSAYSAGTTYALADRVILVSPTSTVTISIATAAVITWAGHGQAIGTPIVFTTTGSLPTGIVSGTRYYIISVTTDTFRISSEINGTPVTTSGTQSGTHTVVSQIHKTFESLQAGNIGHYPTLAASSTWWLEVGATNRWKMFDTSVSSQTANPNTIDVVIAATGRVNAVALINIYAASARVIMTDGVDGVVFDQTTSLVSDSGITDWYAYFFEPIVRKSDLVTTGMPPYSNASIEVILTDTGSNVLCGALVLGTEKIFGCTQYGMSIGIQDYSIKTRNTFGDYTILQRAFNKRATFDVRMANSLVDEAQNILAEYRATPIVYYGSDDFSSSILLGFYKDFTISVTYALDSDCNITLEGLT